MRFALPVLAAAFGLLTLPVHAFDIAPIMERAAKIEALETIIVASEGQVIGERAFDGANLDHPTNIKSASKSVISAMVGMAIERGILEGTDQKIAEFFRKDLPRNADPRLQDITIGHLLSMQAGLEPASGDGYGRWILSRNWVRSALDRPFVDRPGGRMLYSSSSSHLLSAILTRASGKSTLQLAENWFAPIGEFVIGGWARDRQGIYFGGNEMAISPRALLAFGEVYRRGGITADGTRLLSAEWIEESWQRRTWEADSGDGYGYGWYLRNIAGENVCFAWGYGGQMLYVVPELDLTVAMTSDDSQPSVGNGHIEALHGLMADIIIAARTEAEAGADSAGPEVQTEAPADLPYSTPVNGNLPVTAGYPGASPGPTVD